MFQGHGRRNWPLGSHVPPGNSLPGDAGAGSAVLRLLGGGVAVWLLVGATVTEPALACEIVDVQNTQNGGCTVDGGDTLTITETGSIETANDGVHAVNAIGGTNTITNRGTITTSGGNASGIHAQGTNNVVTNRGSIVTDGNNGHGVNVLHGNNVVNNWGSIRTTQLNGVGIRSADGDNILTNWSSIVTEGIRAYGIYGLGGDTTITNWGNILTGGQAAYGIFVQQAGNTIINQGAIDTTANGAVGIFAPHGNNIVTNWGDISTVGLGGHGIHVQLSGNTVTNHGTVRTEQVAAHGLFALSGDNVISNSGMVVSERSNAIRFSNDFGNTLNLLAPGYLGGRINLGGGTRVNLMTGPSNSVLWDFSEGVMDDGAPTITGPYAGFYNADTQEYATFDPTALAGTVNQFGHMQGLLSGIGRSGLSRRESAHVQVADSIGETASDGGGVLPWDGRVWAGVFGGFYDHDGDAATLDRDIDLKGFAAGYSARPVAGLAVSAMAGYLRGSQDADAKFAPSYRLDSKGIFAGANGRMDFGLFDLDVGLTGGRLSYDSDRFINDNLATGGASWASASFDGWFVIPEVGVSTTFEWTDIITVRPSARVSYAYQRIGSYRESGSRADASVDGRTLSLLTGTAELSFERQLSDIVTINALGGYTKRLNVGDDAVSMQLINVTNEVEIGDTDSAAFYAGGGLSIDIGDHVNLAVEARTYLNGDFSGTEGHARLSIAF